MALMAISQALALAQTAGLDRLDAQLLLLHALQLEPEGQGTRRAWLLAHGEDVLQTDAAGRYQRFVAQRASGVPLAYIVGHKEFYGLMLAVDPRVLVPRPETELLVDWALQLLAGLPRPGAVRQGDVLDLGTGSGAVALAIKHVRPDLIVRAVDASAEALQVAAANARRLQLAIEFLHGSWYEPVKDRYQCIVSNPPYIAELDAHLPSLRHEPAHALVSGADGLLDIQAIVRGASAHLQPGGWLLVEHGFQQAASVRAIFEDVGFGNVTSRRDLAGHERCTGGRVIASDPASLMK